jgi:dUTP pyrophosphatase
LLLAHFIQSMAGDLEPLVKKARSEGPAQCPPLKVKKLSADAIAPLRGSAGAAGYDLFASKAVTIPARGKFIVPTDIAMAIPEGYYGRVAPRSGLAAKHHIDVGAGVIDCDYRGAVGVVLFNHADTAYEIAKGDRVAQLVITKIDTPEVIEVDDLEDTVRGAGGFGSTGFNQEVKTGAVAESTEKAA